MILTLDLKRHQDDSYIWECWLVVYSQGYIELYQYV